MKYKIKQAKTWEEQKPHLYKCCGLWIVSPIWAPSTIMFNKARIFARKANKFKINFAKCLTT